VGVDGTRSYDLVTDLPPLVRRAVEAARAHRFSFSCRVEQGRLLSAIAAVTSPRIGETGTGTGVGLAWMASAAPAGTTLVSVDHNPRHAQVARSLFSDVPQAQILDGDWSLLYEHGPFDLLVLDGGGNGKNGTPPADPRRLLAPGGVLVMDDFSPSTSWPPTYQGAIDHERLTWLRHPALHAAEITVAADLAGIVAVRAEVPVQPG
jgi:predicted O-methyltransferase YrrM